MLPSEDYTYFYNLHWSSSKPHENQILEPYHFAKIEFYLHTSQQKAGELQIQ